MVGVLRDQRLPPQGGLPPTTVSSDVLVVACDESGFSGTNLLDKATPVFTHASVDVSHEEAVELIERLRADFPWPSEEMKAGPFLRGPQADSASAILLDALRDRAHVHVVDKEYFLVTRVVDLFLAEPSYAAGTRLTGARRAEALALYRARHRVASEWEAFLAAFVELVRTRRGHRPGRDDVHRFFAAREALAAGRIGADAEDVLAALSRKRVRAVVRRLVEGDRTIPPPLEPLIPALAETVLHWSDGRRPVLVVHDEQSALTADRLRRLQQALTTAPRSADVHDLGRLRAGVSPLAGLVSIDSRDDPRVQVADLLAGVSRRSTDLDADERLRSFVSPTSLRDPQG